MVRLSPRRAGLALLAGVFVLAGVLTQLDLRLASSQAVTLVAREAEGEVPLDDPVARVWDGAEPVEIPLSAQNVATPQGGGFYARVAGLARDFVAKDAAQLGVEPQIGILPRVAEPEPELACPTPGGAPDETR